MKAYYNEIDSYAAQMLRNLIEAGHIAPGFVDERSIEDVQPNELAGYTQCHFFAGVGVWSYALRKAGWPDDRPVWTGSCPCQPFSSAGEANGFDDERHLWPHFQWLIQQCRPSEIFGEQVASKDADPWVDLVHADMEAMGYAFGCVPFPAAGVGAPNLRDRAYWVAHSNNSGSQGGVRWGAYPERSLEHGHSGRCGPVNGFWSGAQWVDCKDDRKRPIEPSTFPLANGIANRVGRLRAYGNAINAYQAQIFIESYLER